MAFYQLAFCYLKRKKAKTILLFFVLLLVGSMILSTNMILRAVGDSRAAIQEKTKAKIVLEIQKEKNKIMQEEIEQIENLQEVSSVNRLDKASVFPASFYPVTGSDSTKESNQKVTLFSFDDLENDSAFYEGRYRLITGDYISKDKKGVVINSMLADFNGLKLGDTVQLENAKENRISLEIIGLFLSGSERDQTDNMDSVNRIENQLFIDNASYAQLLKKKGYLKTAVYCKNPEQLSSLEKQLRLVFQDKVSYTSSDTLYQQMALPLNQITRVVKLMLALTLVTGIVVVSLLLCMWMRTRQKETAIFISIGKSKAAIFSQMFLESFCVFLLSVVGASVLGSFMADILRKVLTRSQTAELSLEVLLQIRDVAHLVGLEGLLVLTAVAISLFPVVKANPKDTLSRMEG